MSFFSDLGAVLKNDAAKDILPVFLADLQAIQANPDLILNPLTQPAELLKLEQDLLTAVSPGGQFAHDLIKDVGALLISYVTNIAVPVAQRALAARKPA